MTSQDSEVRKIRLRNLPRGPSFVQKYHSRVYLPHNEYEAEIAAHFKLRCNTTEEEDFAPVFLAHAHLYTFTCMRMIENLKALALKKPHATLTGFRLCENWVQDIVELARYAYTSQHIFDRTDNGEIDEPKDLIVSYIAAEVDSAMCVAFLEEGGKFDGDFWNIILNGLL